MPAKVSQYMTPKVISVKPDTGIREAFFTMKQHHIRHLPVLDGKQLVGIISDRQLRRPNWVDEAHDIAHVYELDDQLAASDLMITQVHVVHTYDTLVKALGVLLDHRIGAAPVLDKAGAVVGMLSAVDLLQAFRDKLNEERGAK